MSDLNKCILLVMKWLDNKDSVSKDELVENRKAAYTAYATAAAAGGAGGAAAGSTYDAGEWLNKYFERAGEDRQGYIDAIDAIGVEKKPQEPESKEWDGEGLPPIGCECEYKSDGHHDGFHWCIFQGLMSDGSYIIEYHHHTSPSMTTCCPFDPSLTKFRPLKTDKEKDREAFIEKAVEIMNSSIDDSQAGWAAALFDADFKAPEGE